MLPQANDLISDKGKQEGKGVGDWQGESVLLIGLSSDYFHIVEGLSKERCLG